jgi:hypothetical protein
MVPVREEAIVNCIFALERSRHTAADELRAGRRSWRTLRNAWPGRKFGPISLLMLVRLSWPHKLRREKGGEKSKSRKEEDGDSWFELCG